MDILQVSAMACFYGFIHYSLSSHKKKKLFPIIEMFRFGIMMMFIYYFLHKASEELFKRRQYLALKFVYNLTLVLFTVYMFICGVIEFFEVTKGNVSSAELCVQWYFISLRFGPVFAEIVFLFFVCLVHSKINMLYDVGTTMVLHNAHVDNLFDAPDPELSGSRKS